MNNKTQLITMLKEEFKHWEELLNTISTEESAASNFVADMTIKDVVTHLTVWQQISVERLEAARQNRKPEYPKWHAEFDPETEEELNEINAWIHETYHAQPWLAVHKEWRERFLHFLELAESAPEQDLLEVGKYAWLKEYPLAAVLLGSYEHHEEHREPLAAWLRQNGRLE